MQLLRSGSRAGAAFIGGGNSGEQSGSADINRLCLERMSIICLKAPLILLKHQTSQRVGALPHQRRAQLSLSRSRTSLSLNTLIKKYHPAVNPAVINLLIRTESNLRVLSLFRCYMTEIKLGFDIVFLFFFSSGEPSASELEWSSLIICFSFQKSPNEPSDCLCCRVHVSC